MLKGPHCVIKSPRKQKTIYSVYRCILLYCGKPSKVEGAMWCPTRQVIETAEGKGESSPSTKPKGIQLALGTAEQERQPVLFLCTDSGMPCVGGYSKGSRATGRGEGNTSRLLNCGKVLLLKWRSWLWKYIMQMSQKFGH